MGFLIRVFFHNKNSEQINKTHELGLKKKKKKKLTSFLIRGTLSPPEDIMDRLVQSKCFFFPISQDFSKP